MNQCKKGKEIDFSQPIAFKVPEENVDVSPILSRRVENVEKFPTSHLLMVFESVGNNKYE